MCVIDSFYVCLCVRESECVCVCVHMCVTLSLLPIVMSWLINQVSCGDSLVKWKQAFIFLCLLMWQPAFSRNLFILVSLLIISLHAVYAPKPVSRLFIIKQLRGWQKISVS